MDIKQEVREFVEGFLLMQYLSKDDSEVIIQENSFDKGIEDIELVSLPRIRYHSREVFSLTLFFNEDYIATRFVPFVPLYSIISKMDNTYSQLIKADLKLDRITNNGRTINVHCKYENFERFLIWLFREISIGKAVHNTNKDRFNQFNMFSQIYGTGVLKSSGIVPYQSKP